ncbi:MAG: glutamate 5-kinase [Opitutaceae bacterium]|nr:glutamate 5-kinase [Opitutaceae bacterium]
MHPIPSKAKRIVVKLGTGILTTESGSIDTDYISAVCQQISELRKSGTQSIVVSSGAVGLGMGIFGLTKRPDDSVKLQACAAIGQSLLIQTWQQAFSAFGITVAQILLTHDDLSIRSRYIHVKAIIEHLLHQGIVPIINENDTVSTEEVKFGDNDLLSAMLASQTESEYLLILSTAPGLIDQTGTGKIVPVISEITPQIKAMAGGTTSAIAVGGMITKIEAATLATKANCGVFIAHGKEPQIILKLLQGNGPGTFFVPEGMPMEAKKHWMTYFQRPNGSLHVDQGAVTALTDNGKSLLASGLVKIEGTFSSGDVIDLISPEEKTFARGQVQFSSEEINRISGKKTDEIKQLFPEKTRWEIIHRNSLVIL